MISAEELSFVAPESVVIAVSFSHVWWVQPAVYADGEGGKGRDHEHEKKHECDR